jgi:hypothetical protein
VAQYWHRDPVKPGGQRHWQFGGCPRIPVAPLRQLTDGLVHVSSQRVGSELLRLNPSAHCSQREPVYPVRQSHLHALSPPTPCPGSGYVAD